MAALYNFVTDRKEELKYGISIIPDFEATKVYKVSICETDTCAEQKSDSLVEEFTKVFFVKTIDYYIYI